MSASTTAESSAALRTRATLANAPLPLLLRLAAPNGIAFFVQACVSMAEVWFVGRLGTSALAAMALAFPFLMLVQTLSAGAIGGAVSSAVARALGAGEPRDRALDPARSLAPGLSAGATAIRTGQIAITARPIALRARH